MTTTSIAGRSASATGAGYQRLGPAHCTGDARSLQNGSTRHPDAINLDECGRVAEPCHAQTGGGQHRQSRGGAANHRERASGTGIGGTGPEHQTAPGAASVRPERLRTCELPAAPLRGPCRAGQTLSGRLTTERGPPCDEEGAENASEQHRNDGSHAPGACSASMTSHRPRRAMRLCAQSTSVVAAGRRRHPSTRSALADE